LKIKNIFQGLFEKNMMLRQRGARLLDEVERSGARRLQTARAWPRAEQHLNKAL